MTPKRATKPGTKGAPQPPAKLTHKDDEKVLRRLHTDLYLVQDWVKALGQRIVTIFEGRDTANKGGTVRSRGATARTSSASWRRPRPRTREIADLHPASMENSILPDGGLIHVSERDHN
jgi:polyphosphate kinase 2 (PPK2 family)